MTTACYWHGSMKQYQKHEQVTTAGPCAEHIIEQLPDVPLFPGTNHSL